LIQNFGRRRHSTQTRTMNQTTKGKWQKILLFGGNRRHEDGPLLRLALAAAKRFEKVVIFTEDLHLDLPTGNGQPLRQKMEYEKSDGLEWVTTEEISPQLLKEYIDENTVGLLINAVWLIKQDVIDLFGNRLFNYHNTRLPQERGAAAYSWKILSQNKEGALTVHKVVAKLDAGDIVKQKEFRFPEKCRVPADFYKFIEQLETSFLMDFLEGKELVSIKQDESTSIYMPRLNTLANGYINWQWSVSEIELFINAFDDPHEGASTFLNGKRLYLKKCFASKDGKNFHPFQAGIVFRKSQESLFVAAKGGGLEIRVVRDEAGGNFLAHIKLGQRFLTPNHFLEEARTTKAVHTTQGIKVQPSPS